MKYDLVQNFLHTQFKFSSVVFAILSLSQLGYGTDFDACNRFLNQGWYRDYKYVGNMPYTRATRDNGFWQGSTNASSQLSTGFFDPKVWVHASTGGSQSTSSWGACSFIAIQNVREYREQYIAQNHDEILIEIAKGEGEHLGSVAFFSFCDRDQYSRLFNGLQNRTRDLVHKSSGVKYNDIIDDVIRSDDKLRSSCYLPADILPDVT